MKIIKKDLLDRVLYSDRDKTITVRIKGKNDESVDATVRDHFKLMIDTPKKALTREISKKIDKVYDKLDQGGDFIVDDSDYNYLKEVFEETEIKVKTVYDMLIEAIDGAEEYNP